MIITLILRCAWVLVVLMLLPALSFTQVYHLKKSDWTTTSVGIALNLAAAHVVNKVEPLSLEQLDHLATTDIGSFDRNAVNQYNFSDANTSNYLLGAAMAAPFALLADRNIRSDYVPLGLMLFEVALLTQGTTNMVKGTVKRNRPFVYNENVPVELKTTREARLSFFSGHVSNTAAFSFFTAHVVSSYSNNATLKTVVWVAAATLPALTGYLRYTSGKHYPTDIIAGYVVGAVIGYMVPQWHKKANNSNLTWQMCPSSIRISYSLN